MKFQCGLDVLCQKPHLAENWGQCAILANHSSINGKGDHAVEALRALLGKRLVSVLSPQHGFFGTQQANMLETKTAFDALLGYEVHSLYSEVRQPTPQMLKGVDTLIMDLPITGCRVYTFKATMAGCLRVASKMGIRVVVLDRPNPKGGEFLEGRTVDPRVRSFVGEYGIPLRHGLSAAEMMRFVAKEENLDPNLLDWIEVAGWDPKDAWGEGSLEKEPWYFPSPNLPSWHSLWPYCGLVLLEACNVSEGRGTCLPFQILGAPYLTPSLLEDLGLQLRERDPQKLKGLRLKPIRFIPTWDKHQGKECGGFMLWPSPSREKGYAFSKFMLAFFQLMASHPDFVWLPPPYEYHTEHPPIDILLGCPQAKEALGEFPVDHPFWSTGVDDYLKKATEILLYPRKLHVL